MRRFLVPLFALLFVSQVAAQEPGTTTQAPDFIRLVRDEAGTVTSLDTAIVRYEKGEGDEKVIVDAIGAIHIADKKYYQALNRQFRKYDALCYELVGAKGSRPVKGEGGFDLYGMIGGVLQLQGQLEGVDYSPANFVHADMSMEDLQKKMAERGDNMFSILLNSILESFRRARKGDEPDTEGLFSSPTKLKRYMAEGMGGDVKGSGLGSQMELYIVKDRNEVAMKVVDGQVELGKRKIGLFYGAAHFPDFHKRLVERGFTVRETTWQTAWDLSSDSGWDILGTLRKLMKRGK